MNDTPNHSKQRKFVRIGKKIPFWRWQELSENIAGLCSSVFICPRVGMLDCV